MDSSLEAIQFLANSPNRVKVLTSLIDGKATRRELQEETDGSRSTVARILDEAQTRTWVESEGSRYWLTPLGETMVTDFQAYLDTVEGVQHLGELINQFPPPLLSLDCRHLRDAMVVEPTLEDPAAPFTRAFDLFQEAIEYRGLTHTSYPHFAKIIRERVDRGLLDSEHVIEKAFIEMIRNDPERSAVWASMSDRVRLYDGIVPISFHIIDGRVLVWLGESREQTEGLLESENPAVVTWAESLYEKYRSESEPFGEF